MTPMFCDFCVIGPVSYVYKIPMGFMPPITLGPFRVDAVDDGGWSACAPCAEVVDQRDEAKLIARVQAVLKEHGLMPNFDDFELAIMTAILEEKFAALFGAGPLKQPI
ncbi:hypothetical protein ACWC5I_02000 [Kitasatospora sp. NPDC001574]